jgi:ATP-dependent Zn protease
MDDFEKAKDKILMGGERKSMVMNDDERNSQLIMKPDMQ